jgi:hypothetical protein
LHNQANASASPGAKLPSGIVSHKAQLLDGCLNLGDIFWRNGLGIVENIAYRAKRNSRGTSYVSNSDRHCNPLFGCQCSPRGLLRQSLRTT